MLLSADKQAASLRLPALSSDRVSPWATGGMLADIRL